MANWTKKDLALHFSRAENGWMNFFNKAATEFSVPVWILLAIGSRETGIKNIKGDGGHGRGIMQIDDRFHADFLKANNEGLDPESNIRYGAKLMASNLKSFDGDMRKALAAYNCGGGNVKKAVARQLDIDYYTTGKDYGRDVLSRAKEMEELWKAKNKLPS